MGLIGDDRSQKLWLMQLSQTNERRTTKITVNA
jgi:hypothetical protein